ncbi:MAG: N,N-dimethylformamidase beta subunit family domain-containing protein [Streptosporangiaceae bacterium]
MPDKRPFCGPPPGRWRAAGVIAAVLLAASLTACSGGSAQARNGQGGASQGSTAAPLTAVSAQQLAQPDRLPPYWHWRITRPARPGQLAGFADRTDVLPGGSFRLFVSTTAGSFRVLALRMGWYHGAQASLVWTSPAVAGHSQPAPRAGQPGATAASWQPSLTVRTGGWPPGSYLLRLDAASGVQSYVPIVIRSPSVTGRIVLLQPVTSYQAGNDWGGGVSSPGGPAQARQFSFDRPLASGDGAGPYLQDELPVVTLAAQLNMPLAYLTSIDLQRYRGVLAGARAVVSEASDQYWSPAMRAAVTRARNRGTNLAFLGAGAASRTIALEPSPLGPDRSAVTGPGPDAAAQRLLTGQSYGCTLRQNQPLVITDPGSWLWAATGARLGQSLPGLVGPAVDWAPPGGAPPGGAVPGGAVPGGRRPARLQVLASSPVPCGGPVRRSSVTYYVAHSGAGVFDAGTQNWTCALPGGICAGRGPAPDAHARAVIETATSNVLRAFAVGPAGRGYPFR